MTNKLSMCLALLLTPGWLFAQENFLTDPVTPYPPGCATNSEAMDLIPGRETEITSGTLQLLSHTYGGPTGEFLDVEMSLIRRGCAEPDRSLLIVELEVIDNGDGLPMSISLPYFRAERWGVDHDIRGVAEPNSWGVHSSGGWLSEGQSIRLFLDGPDMADPNFDPARALTPEEYNGDWTLEIYEPMWNSYRINVPEYRNQLQPNGFVLNGRLTGVWWVPSASDQGVYLGFQEQVNDDSGLVFMSWMTFGPNGENLWFSAVGAYQAGDHEVVMDLEWVRDGEFMGATTAARSVVGTVTLTANSCNDLTMTYELDFPGLDNGVRRLERPFSLETQGYACRDHQARLDDL